MDFIPSTKIQSFKDYELIIYDIEVLIKQNIIEKSNNNEVILFIRNKLR